MMLLIGNGCVITRDPDKPIVENGAVATENDRIIEVGGFTALRGKYPQARLIDAHGGLIMPGLINAHMHFYSTYARGMMLDSVPPANFGEILERLWWRLDKVLTLQDVYYSAMVPILDCIKCGVTTVFDHHASPNCAEGSLSRIAEATTAAGLRACLCYEVSDRDGEAIAATGIRENAAFIRRCGQDSNPLLRALFGLHASLTLSDRTLERCAAGNPGAGYHIHAAEGMEDVKDARQKYGCGVIERLHARGILGNNTIAAHCVHVSDAEMDLLAQTGTNVAHNPESNMGNAVGAAPVLEMTRRGVVLGMGTDGYTCDMFESLKAANCLHKHATGNPSAAWGEPPQMLFETNAAIASRFFGAPLGVLKPGAFADAMVADYDPPTPLIRKNINSHMLFGLTGRAVETTVIGGRVVMQDRRLTELNEQEICAKSRELAAKLWQRI
jgi:putative selenium metabolism protein SsnA